MVSHADSLAVLTGGSSDYHPLLHDRLPSPTTMGYTGASLSPTTLSRLWLHRVRGVTLLGSTTSWSVWDGIMLYKKPAIVAY